MPNCELFTVSHSQAEVSEFNNELDNIAKQLRERKLNVIYNTEITPDAKKISKALQNSQKSPDSPDYYIFANALDTQDAESFKALFSDYIKGKEQQINSNKKYKGHVKIKITNLGDLGNGYLGYCFSIYDKHYIVIPRCSLAKRELTELVIEAVDRAAEIFKKERETNPKGFVFLDASGNGKSKSKKKEGFFSSFIPHKVDSKGTKIRKVIVLCAILIFLVAGGYLLNELVIQPYLNSQITSEIYDIAYDNDKTSKPDPDAPAQNWKALKKINKEIVGWITIDDTKIDYPVLEHKGDNAYSQYYLYRTYKKGSSQHGSVFVDYRCKDSVKSKNVILHGHNMKFDGTMFSALMGYGDLTGNLKFYKKHPVIDFNTPEADSKYKIISVFKTSTYYAHGEFFNYMQADFLSDAEFMNFVYNVRERSLIDCPVMVNEDDTLLTLSTCSYEFSGFRTVVVARKVREGEKADVDVELATLNKDPLFPEVYYQSRGGKRPDIKTFKKANEKGLVSWYDGEGDLEGSEVLTATVEANPTEPPTTKKDKKKSSKANTTNYYEVKFVNWDGTEYQTVSVKEGDSVTPPSGTPGLPSDDYYDYKFTGWDTKGLDLDNVHYSMTIYPNFKAIQK